MSASSWAGAVEDVRRALAPKGRAQLGQFVVEGMRLVERALRAGVVPRRLIISDRLFRQHDQHLRSLLGELERAQCEIVSVPEGVVLELAEGRNGGNLFALCSAPRPPQLAELRAQAQAERQALLVLVDVEEPGNVGALVRTALAAGAAGLIAVGLSDPFHPKAVRTSMGSLFKLPLVRVPTVDTVLDALGPLPKVAAVSTGGAPPWQLPLGAGMALFMGKESDGLSEALVTRLDHRVSIPMQTGVDSFSVNAAAAALLCEALRQKMQ